LLAVRLRSRRSSSERGVLGADVARRVAQALSAAALRRFRQRHRGHNLTPSCGGRDARERLITCEAFVTQRSQMWVNPSPTKMRLALAGLVQNMQRGGGRLRCSGLTGGRFGGRGFAVGRPARSLRMYLR
jgi:hypothetical protein